MNSTLPRLLFLLASLSFADCQPNQQSQVRPRRAAEPARVIRVQPGQSLQEAIKAADFGDRIVLEPGRTYEGPLTLPYKPSGSGSEYITIETADVSTRIKEGERVKPSTHAAWMAKIVSSGGKPLLVTSPRAHHFRFIGIEFAPAVNAEYVYNLIDLGSSDQKSLEDVPHDLIFDRCYVHSTGLNKARRGFALNSGDTSILNSHVSGFAGAGDETQAIAGWNGPGPFKIVNNYLEGGAEIMMFGGSDPSIPNLVPSDIQIKGNYLFRPAEWKGRASIKGSFELKNARRVTIEANVIDSQILTTAIVLTVRNQNGNAPWSTIEDVDIRNNLVRNATSGVNILGSDNERPSQTARRIRVQNNLMIGLVRDQPDNAPYFLQVNGGEDITIQHNTVDQGGNIITSYGAPTSGFVFKDNIVTHNLYGVVCQVQNPCSGGAFCQCFPDGIFRGNVFVDNANAIRNEPGIQSHYPPGNFFVGTYEQLAFVNYRQGNWRLAPSSKLKGRASDGKDPGVDFALFEQSGVQNNQR